MASPQILSAIQAWLNCPVEKRPSAKALGERIADLANEAHDPDPRTHQEPNENVIETWAKRAYYPGCGRSAGAAARDLISDLGANGCAPNLKSMLEDLLADANRASHEHYETRETLREVVRDIPKN